MPLYEYNCEHCKTKFEKVVPLKDWDSIQPCPECGWGTVKVITIGGIQDDHPVWLNQSVRDQLQDTDSPHIPIETRQQYDKHLKDNGITAL